VTKRLKIPTTPHIFQARAVVSPKPIVGVIAGARSGKTTTGGLKTAIVATRQPGFTVGDLDNPDGYVLGVGAPTFRMLFRVVVPEIRRSIPRELVIEDRAETKQRMVIRGRWGRTTIFFLSAQHAASWYGLKLAWAWVDEFPLVKEMLFDELQTRLSDRKGQLFLTGTPQGPNWAYDRIYLPWTQDRGDVDFFTWRTVDNPFMDRAFIESKRKTMPPKYFRRTFEASFETFQGQIFEDYSTLENERQSTDFRFIRPDGVGVGFGAEIVRLKEIVAGVDWGFAHNGVIVVVGIALDGRVFVLEESVASGLLVRTDDARDDTWVRRARKLAARWAPATFFCGEDRPENILHFGREGLRARRAVTDVKDGILSIATAIHPLDDGRSGLVVLRDACPVLAGEIARYHWMTTSDGTEKEEPHKVDDDTVDALRYALHSSQKRKAFRRQIRGRDGRYRDAG